MNPLPRQLTSLHLNETLLWILLKDISFNDSAKLTNMQMYAAPCALITHAEWGPTPLCPPTVHARVCWQIKWGEKVIRHFWTLEFGQIWHQQLIVMLIDLLLLLQLFSLLYSDISPAVGPIKKKKSSEIEASKIITLSSARTCINLHMHELNLVLIRRKLWLRSPYRDLQEPALTWA